MHNSSSKTTARKTKLDYSALVEFVSIGQIVFEEVSPLQPWSCVRDLISICSPTLVGIELGIADESFLDLPTDYIYLQRDISLPKLKFLKLKSKCMKVPHQLVLELLRSASVSSLKSIKFDRCITNFDGSEWFLVSERGGSSLTELSLTPSVGPNMLAWEEQVFHNGIQLSLSNCPNLKKLDLSGHAIPVKVLMIEEMLKTWQDLTHLYLPCTSNDAHLLALTSQKPWKNLKVLGLSCCCVDGEMKESKKNGLSCNRFTDSVLVSLLDHLLETESKIVSVYLPVYLVSIKDGKRQATDVWLGKHPHVVKRDDNSYCYKDRIILSVPTNRMTIFF